MNCFARVGAAGAGALLLTLAGIVQPSASFAAALTCTGPPGDVNGDGYAEVAVGEPGDAVRRGGVHVLYGQKAGLVADASGTARDDQWFSKGAAGVPGTARHHDDFALAVKFGDFNGDGCADLAIGAPSAPAADGLPDAAAAPGDVTVLYGSPTGIVTAGAQTFSLASMFGTGPGASRFGSALITGDLNDDGIDDLAIGAPFTDLSDRGDDLDRAGAVAVAFGSSAGLDRGPTDAVLIDEQTDGIPDSAQGFAQFGSALAIGDFDDDGDNELAVGTPGRTVGDHALTGAVVVVSGGTTGFATVTATRITQDTEGVPGGNEIDDQFGSSVAAGDVTGDGRDDLVVGVPNEDSKHGAVIFVPGSSSGLTGVKSQKWDQSSAGVSGAPDFGDQFGLSIAVGRLDTDKYADVAVGAPADGLGQIANAGTVTLLRGAASGLTTAGAGGTRISADTAGVGGVARTGSGFGFGLAAAYVQGGTQANLIVGSPSALSGDRFGGLINQHGRSKSGPTGSSSRTFGQHTTGVRGTAVDGDSFGLAVG